MSLDVIFSRKHKEQGKILGGAFESSLALEFFVMSYQVYVSEESEMAEEKEVLASKKSGRKGYFSTILLLAPLHKGHQE